MLSACCSIAYSRLNNPRKERREKTMRELKMMTEVKWNMVMIGQREDYVVRQEIEMWIKSSIKEYVV